MFGTALFITMMSRGAKSYLLSSADPSAPLEAVNSLAVGFVPIYFVMETAQMSG
jgi:DNA-binding NarL/FixJ family response regulator